jgi:hypothetical protein
VAVKGRPVSLTPFVDEIDAAAAAVGADKTIDASVVYTECEHEQHTDDGVGSNGGGGGDDADGGGGGGGGSQKHATSLLCNSLFDPARATSTNGGGGHGGGGHGGGAYSSDTQQPQVLVRVVGWGEDLVRVDMQQSHGIIESSSDGAVVTTTAGSIVRFARLLAREAAESLAGVEEVAAFVAAAAPSDVTVVQVVDRESGTLCAAQRGVHCAVAPGCYIFPTRLIHIHTHTHTHTRTHTRTHTHSHTRTRTHTHTLSLYLSLHR